MKSFFPKTKHKKPPPDTRRILICGDRKWNDFDLIRKVLTDIGPENIKTVIEGGATGADRLAGLAARILGIKILIFPANWTKFDKAAGPIRNRQMIKEGKPSLVIAFHDNIKNSKGTKDMLEVAEEHGIRTDLVTHKKPYIEEFQ